MRGRKPLADGTRGGPLLIGDETRHETLLRQRPGGIAGVGGG